MFAVRRWRVVVFAVLSVVAASTAATTAALGGSGPKSVPIASADQAVSATSVGDVIAAVQARFGDGFIQSASIAGSTVRVNVAKPDVTWASTIGGFEAAVLAHAVADWQRGNAQTAATTFSAVAPNGQPTTGMVTDFIGADSNATPLAAGKCESVAQQTPASLAVAYAATLPFAGGTCIVKVRTTGDPNAAAAAVATAMTNEIPTPTDYPYLIEVDDSTGTPALIFTWVPGSGSGLGEGGEYVRPGLTSASHG